MSSFESEPHADHQEVAKRHAGFVEWIGELLAQVPAQCRLKLLQTIERGVQHIACFVFVSGEVLAYGVYHQG